MHLKEISTQLWFISIHYFSPAINSEFTIVKSNGPIKVICPTYFLYPQMTPLEHLKCDLTCTGNFIGTHSYLFVWSIHISNVIWQVHGIFCWRASTKSQECAHLLHGADWVCQVVPSPTLHQWWLEVANKDLSFLSPGVADSQLSFILYPRGSHYEWSLLPISWISSLTLKYFLIFFLSFLHSLTRMCWHNLPNNSLLCKSVSLGLL